MTPKDDYRAQNGKLYHPKKHFVSEKDNLIKFWVTEVSEYARIIGDEVTDILSSVKGLIIRYHHTRISNTSESGL